MFYLKAPVGEYTDDDGKRWYAALRETAINKAIDLSKAWGTIEVIDEPSRGSREKVGYAEDGKFVWTAKVKQPFQ